MTRAASVNPGRWLARLTQWDDKQRDGGYELTRSVPGTQQHSLSSGEFRCNGSFTSSRPWSLGRSAGDASRPGGVGRSPEILTASRREISDQANHSSTPPLIHPSSLPSCSCGTSLEWTTRRFHDPNRHRCRYTYHPCLLDVKCRGQS